MDEFEKKIISIAKINDSPISDNVEKAMMFASEMSERDDNDIVSMKEFKLGLIHLCSLIHASHD